MATLYYVIYPSAESEPSATQIKAGQRSSGSAATASGSTTANTANGEQIFASAATGLTQGTSYKVSFVWNEGAYDSNVSTSAAFSTTAVYSASLNEAAISNAVRNPTAQGAVVGTPGTFPTYWSSSNPAGVAVDVVATGTESGYPYVDIRVSGTPTVSTGSLNFEGTTAVPAVLGQTWTNNLRPRVVAGNFTNITQARLNLLGRTSGGAATADSLFSSDIRSSVLASTDVANYRASYTARFLDATTAFVQPRLFFNWTIGTAVDVTLRIADPYLELSTEATLIDIGLSRAESGAASDSATRAAVSARSLTESGTASDSATRAAVSARSLTESGTASDAATTTVVDAISLSESATSGESAARAVVVGSSLAETSIPNAIRNPGAAGAVAGIPGTFPTNWNGQGGTINGVVQEIVGTGIEDGLSYIDIRYSGTPTANSNGPNFVRFEGIGQIVVVPGQVWTGEVYAKLVGGSLANLSALMLGIDEYDSTPTYLTGVYSAIAPNGNALGTQKFSLSRRISNAAAAQAMWRLAWNYTTGNPIDITLRVAAPSFLPAAEVAYGEFVRSPSEPGSAADTALAGNVLSVLLSESVSASDSVVAGSVIGSALAEASIPNAIRNSTANGAVSGTPGTTPTYWSVGGLPTGVNREIVGSGVEDSLPYVDIRFFGTSTAGTTQFPGIFFETGTAIPASPGQAWTVAVNVRCTAGTPISFDVNVHENDGTGLFLRNRNVLAGPAPSTTGTLATNKRSGSFVVTGPTSFIRPVLACGVAPGQTIDFTLRVAAPTLLPIAEVAYADFGRLTSESGSASDSPTVGVVIPASISEAGSSADSASRVNTLGTSPSEAGSATDAPAAGATTSRSLVEAATSADLSSITFDQSVGESVSASDSLSRSYAANPSLTDPATAADSASATHTVVVALADPAAAADTASTIPTYVRAISELGVAAEAAAVALTTSRAANEAGSGADTSTPAATHSRATAEPATGADSGTAIANAVASRSESAGAVDSTTNALSVQSSRADSVSASDAAARVLTAGKALVEALSAGSLEARGVTALRAITESASAAELIWALRQATLIEDIAVRASVTDAVLAAYITEPTLTVSANDIQATVTVLLAELES